MPMKNPAHPGEILATMYLEPLGLTVTQAAAALKMPRAALSSRLDRRRRVVRSGSRFSQSVNDGRNLTVYIPQYCNRTDTNRTISALELVDMEK